jgi:hypothetical protein
MVDQAPATKADIERIESKLDHILRAIGEVLETLKPSQRESDLAATEWNKAVPRRVRSTILAMAAAFDFADVLQRPLRASGPHREGEEPSLSLNVQVNPGAVWSSQGSLSVAVAAPPLKQGAVRSARQT